MIQLGLVVCSLLLILISLGPSIVGMNCYILVTDDCLIHGFQMPFFLFKLQKASLKTSLLSLIICHNGGAVEMKVC